MNDDVERILGTPPRARHLAAAGRLQPPRRTDSGAGLAGPLRLKIPSAPDAQLLFGDPAQPLASPHCDPQPQQENPLATQTLIEAAPDAPQTDLACGPAPTTDRPTEFLLAAWHLKKSYRKGSIEVPVLRDVSLEVCTGEFLAIVGQSGSGKSTLLHLLGTLDVPDEGGIYFDGRRIDNMAVSARDRLRNRQLGMIFQFYHLLPELTTLENVLAPAMIAESCWQFFWNRRKHRSAARELLELVGLGHRLHHKPSELSGGEMQRAAIARALIARPRVLLADEPTGNLDRETGEEILKILRTLNRDQKLTIVMVTHDQAIADQADRIVRLANGRIEEA